MTNVVHIINRISYERVLEAVTFIENYLTSRNIIFQPRTGIICGSDLGTADVKGFAIQPSLGMLGLDLLSPALDYQDIPNLPFSSKPGYGPDGKLLLGSLGTEHCIVFQGRAHMYQGFTAAEV